MTDPWYAAVPGACEVDGESLQWFRLAAAFVIALLVARAAAATDGVLQISQACVATGCFPGDNASFPVEINAPGSFILTSSLEGFGLNTTAIQISSAGGSLLDLNGFQIRGTYSCNLAPPDASCPPTTGNGIGIDAFSMITIKNGSIRNIGGRGIVGTSAGGVIVDNVQILTTGSDSIRLGSGNVVRGSKVRSSGADGIHLAQGLVQDCIVTTVRGDAIELEDAGIVRGSFARGGLGADLRLGLNASGYTQSSFGNVPIGGRNLGGNVCSASAGVCP